MTDILGIFKDTPIFEILLDTKKIIEKFVSLSTNKRKQKLSYQICY